MPFSCLNIKFPMCKLHVNTCKWSSISSCDAWCSYWDCCGLSDVSSHGVAECVCWSVSSVGKHLVSRVRSHESESPSWWITFWCFIHPRMTFVFFVRFILFSKMINEKEYERFKKDTEEHHGRPHSFSVNVLSVIIQHCFQGILFLRHDVALQLKIRHWQ